MIESMYAAGKGSSTWCADQLFTSASVGTLVIRSGHRRTLRRQRARKFLGTGV